MVNADAPQEQKDNRAEYMRGWRDDNPERAKEISRTANTKFRDINHNSYIQSKRKHRQKIRLEIHSFFGGKCIKCGNSNFIVLQLDHKLGGGMKDRKENPKEFDLSYRYKMIKEKPHMMREKY